MRLCRQRRDDVLMPESGNKGVKKSLRDIDVINLQACRRDKTEIFAPAMGYSCIRTYLGIVGENAGT